MKMVLMFGILLYGFQHAGALVLEVYNGSESVLLPCSFGNIPEEPTLTWTCSHLVPKTVHQQRDEKDYLIEQNQQFTGRTFMNRNALASGNFSLTLREPQLFDTGEYTCSLHNGREERKLTEVHLKVKDDLEEVEVTEGAESVILPCGTLADLYEDTSVEWTLSEPEFMMVHALQNKTASQKQQDSLYRGRTEMKEVALLTGDLSLTLMFPTERDSGSYICNIYRDQDILRHRVVLNVMKDTFPSWAKALVVLLVLAVVVVSAGLIYFRQYLMSEYRVELDYGMESIVLPCKSIFPLIEDVWVEWADGVPRIVHVLKNGSDKPEEQDEYYRNRTEMTSNLKSGDLSLTLKHPTHLDTDTYTCKVYSREDNILMKKQVHLQVKGVK